MNEIRDMKRNDFIKLINESIKKKGLEYLQKLRGNKGKEINYKEVKMADYLMPNQEELTITDKRYIFSMRNRMIKLPTNFPTRNQIIDENCEICGERENMKHLYECKWSQENNNIEYENIFGNNLKKMRKVYSQFKLKYENRDDKRKYPGDPPFCDPLVFINEISNGNRLTKGRVQKSN